MNVLIVELIENILLDTFYDDAIYFRFYFSSFYNVPSCRMHAVPVTVI